MRSLFAKFQELVPGVSVRPLPTTRHLKIPRVRGARTFTGKAFVVDCAALEHGRQLVDAFDDRHFRQEAVVLKLAAWLGLLLVAACKGGDRASAVQAPGADKSAETATLEVGAAAMQRMPPIAAINAYLDGFHFYNGRLQQQMEAHHYCAILNEDLIQCVIFDGNSQAAKLMGLEYIVSDRLFAGLPGEEKPLWHSHVHEVKSGQLVAPGIPQAAEHELMKKLIHTYGKTWHTWHTDAGDRLPLGIPQLMMGFTADGQSDPSLVESRDRRFGIDSAAKKSDRANIQAPAVDPAADAWQHGTTLQITDPRAPQ
jgi:hypothetical protein